MFIFKKNDEIVDLKKNLRVKKPKIIPYYDEPGIYQTIGLVAYATTTFLYAVRIFDGFEIQLVLTVWGFFIGGLAELISGLYCFKFNHYIDGDTHLFFAFYWGVMSSLDIFVWVGWMVPLNEKEYGFLFLMCCFFNVLFFLHNICDKALINALMYSTNFLGYFFSCLGYFIEKKGVVKTGGVFFFISSFFGYYKGFAIDVNVKYKRTILPMFDKGDNLMDKVNNGIHLA